MKHRGGGEIKVTLIFAPDDLPQSIYCKEMRQIVESSGGFQKFILSRFWLRCLNQTT